jgi:putative heme-binding domain-containing protein
MFSHARHRLLIAIGLLWFVWTISSFPLQSQQTSPTRRVAKEPLLGSRIYSSDCSGCHGLDGRGTERAPNIATSAKVRALSDEEIGNIISEGIPATGMPGFHSLSPAQVQSLVAYMRSMQGDGDSKSLFGNAARGKAIFFGKGECSNCHMVQGQGGFAGPDLTYDSSMSAKTIREGIVSPTRVVRRGYKRAVLTMRDGKRMQGLLRNEDNFSVQLQDEDGQYHFFQKSDLQSLEYVKEPLMPTDYGTRLTASEIDDLVSFLMHSAAPAGKTNPVKRGEYEE